MLHSHSAAGCAAVLLQFLNGMAPANVGKVPAQHKQAHSSDVQPQTTEGGGLPEWDGVLQDVDPQVELSQLTCTALRKDTQLAQQQLTSLVTRREIR